MVDERSEPKGAATDYGVVEGRVRRARWRRVGRLLGLGAIALLVTLVVVAWLARRPIADNLLEGEFRKRGVQATYRLDRIGLRTQEVSNLVIGDPKRPDLVARYAQVQVRVNWNGSIEVYRIVARGVRLRGRLQGGKVSWGQIDKMLPPPSGKPFQLPNFAVDLADTQISLATPFGAIGAAIEGAGNLSGGFKGRVAAASPRLVPGRCQIDRLRANLRVQVTARRPQAVGPLTVDKVDCPSSRLTLDKPRFEIDSRFNESFTDYDGKGRMAIAALQAGDNGLANLGGELTFKGDPKATYGAVKLSAQRSRLAAIYAERTRLDGRYRLGLTGGTLVMVADYAASSATLASSATAAITRPLAAAAKTPIGPVATAIGRAVERTVRDFDAEGSLRLVNFAGGGAIRIESANVRGPTGGRVRITGGDGITYYWPSGRLRLDGQVETSGGGLPQGRIDISQPRSGAPISGTATFAPYTVGGSRLALAPVRFVGARDGSTSITTIAVLDGPFPDGRVRALRLPINARLGAGGGFSLGTGCVVVSWDYIQMRALQIAGGRLPVCPTGRSILEQVRGAGLKVGARTGPVRLAGRLGQSPLLLTAGNARFSDRDFAASAVAMRLGKPQSPILFNTATLTGTFSGSGVNGTFAGGAATIGNVPLAMSDASGRWKVYKGDLTVDSALTVSDRFPNPRFYPLRSDNVRFTLAGDYVRANGSLRHPGTGTLVTNVDIEHSLSAATGHADLAVPGITFGPGLQPEQLTRLTEGVIALVNGSVRGSGRIDWAGTKVTSSGDFTTDDLDLAAPFGPVTGMKGTIHFDDLLALKTPPGQTMAVASINPGILVENGVIRYQLLPGQLVKVERGEWPFMGGTLILRETVLNFARPTAKRLTFEVVGLNAHTFVESMGFKEIGATGIFDGVLPMIFDENGGRIVGGRLDSRPGGGSLSYNGVVNKANLGMMGNIAFNALRDLRFRSMIVRLDGELSGEFATRLTIDGVALGQTGTQKLIRGLLKRLPLKMNVTIKGPFRALIATAKAFRDPRAIIADVLPRPLDEVPGIVTEVRRRDEDTAQTQTPVEQKIERTPTPPAESEKKP